MSVGSVGNVHGLQFRETKTSQGKPSAPVSGLFRLENRTIIITGATGFLGTALAIAVLESGGDVVCLDVAATPVAENWGEVEAAATKYGGKLEVGSTFAKFTETLRYPIKGLVTCAGISRNGPATEFSPATFRRVLDINVTGTFLIAQATANELLKTGNSGSMVFVASMSGHVSNKGVDTAGYNSSKAAVHQLARSLAVEWGSRKGMPLVRVNTLSPGYIRTAATAEALDKPGMEAQWVGDNMLYRLSTVDEFRGPVIYMLGDGSSFMTSADLRVDG